MVTKLNQLLLGNQKFVSNTARKQSILLGQLGLLSGFICLIYLILDPINGLYTFVKWYAIGLLITIIILQLNRSGRYLLSASAMLSFSVAILFIIALLGNQNRGVYFLHIAAAVTSLVLFYDRKISIAYFFIGLFMASALVAYFIDSPFEESLAASDDIVRINFVINFVFATLTSVLVFLFIIRRSNETEQSLIESKEDLEQLTNDLKVSTKRFERAMAATNAGIYEWNLTTGEIYVSPRWKTLHRFAANEELDISLDVFMSMVHPEDSERTSQSLNDALGGNRTYQNEYRLKGKDGEYKWFLDSGIIEMEGGKPSVAVGSIIMIDDRKNAESELIEKNNALIKANDELDRFVYSASHDMRAPLTTLLGLIEVVKMSEDSTEHEKYFGMMTRRIQDMEGFIAEITDYSRNTRLDVKLKEISLFDLLEKTKEAFHTTAASSGVSINNNIDKSLSLYSDTTRLQVVLNNLISNAIKYNSSPEKSKFVNISANINSGNCIIEIEDNGDGINEIYHDKIFDMFFRATEDASGSGLGLYIVMETIDKLGGAITFNSKLGQGTTFTITIPARNKE